MNNIYKLKLTRLQQEILRLLCVKVGETLSLRGIARFLDVSPTAVSKSIPLLEKEELINKEEKNKSYFIGLNYSNHKVIQYKRVENLRSFYESGLADFLIEKYPGSTIVLFGSYSLGEDIISSDIDIAVIGYKKEADASKFEKKLERKIIINLYPSFREINRNLKENIFNGILIKGGVEL